MPRHVSLSPLTPEPPDVPHFAQSARSPFPPAEALQFPQTARSPMTDGAGAGSPEHLGRSLGGLWTRAAERLLEQEVLASLPRQRSGSLMDRDPRTPSVAGNMRTMNVSWRSKPTSHPTPEADRPFPEPSSPAGGSKGEDDRLEFGATFVGKAVNGFFQSFTFKQLSTMRGGADEEEALPEDLARWLAVGYLALSNLLIDKLLEVMTLLRTHLMY
eukprot:Hpha_TRINITY_DN9179_c0_g1::TRINITY_DN9179_c0_g1_i1::g.94635::m.94635